LIEQPENDATPRKTVRVLPPLQDSSPAPGPDAIERETVPREGGVDRVERVLHDDDRLLTHATFGAPPPAAWRTRGGRRR
jgi:hypothetical protein